MLFYIDLVDLIYINGTIPFNIYSSEYIHCCYITEFGYSTGLHYFCNINIYKYEQ